MWLILSKPCRMQLENPHLKDAAPSATPQGNLVASGVLVT